MFGKYDSIRDESCTPYFFPDYKDIPSDTSTERWSDRIYPDGRWEANLFQFYRRALLKLQMNLPTPFNLENGQRQDNTPAHDALREAMANLCVHADYNEQGSLTVNRYVDKITFSNPGTMLISREQFFRGGESVCRNPSLQKMFMMIGFVEQAGSGVDKILKGWASSHLKPPYPCELIRPNKIELVLPLESLIDQDIIKELVNRLGPSYVERLDEYERVLLATALSEECVNNERLKEILPVHKSDITSKLRKLCNDGVLQASGYGRGRTYHLTSISSEERLQAIPIKMNAQNRKDIIENYCAEWRTAQEIAVFLERDKNYVRNKVLPSLLAEGFLEQRYNTKRHPNQQYRTKSKE